MRPKLSGSANGATRDIKKLYVRQKSFHYHYNQYARPNRTSLFNKEKTFNGDLAWNYAVDSLLLHYDESQIKFLFLFEIKVKI